MPSRSPHRLLSGLAALMLQALPAGASEVLLPPSWLRETPPTRPGAPLPAPPGTWPAAPRTWSTAPRTWPAAPRSPAGTPTWVSLLFAQLDEGDRNRLPRVQRLPDGRIRYVYRRRSDEPPLTLGQISSLLVDPPRYERERATILELLGQLRALGVRVLLAPPRHGVASGEWSPRSATLKIRPDVPGRGSADFARVLNHEAIHVAQSCRGGGLRATPALLGLRRGLTPEQRRLLALPIYAGAPPAVREVEAEAFANQANLDLGPALLDTHCRGMAAAPVVMVR